MIIAQLPLARITPIFLHPNMRCEKIMSELQAHKLARAPQRSPFDMFVKLPKNSEWSR